MCREHNLINIECDKSVILDMNQIPYCLPCKRFKVFKHATQKHNCVICGGSQICIEHNCIKSHCKDCSGSQICIEHNRRKSQCRECGGSSICKEHNREKTKCRECGNELVKTIRRFIRASRTADKKHNRFDAVNFIDKPFCKTIINESNNTCCYCQCELDFVKYGSNMITIERIDNSLGHIKGNVKIACFHCNSSKVGSK